MKSIPRRTRLFSLAITLALYTGYHFAPRKTKVLVVCDESPETALFLNDLSYLNDTHFYPSFYLPGRVMQSGFAAIEPAKQVRYDREYLKLPDGGQVCLDWANPMKKISYENNQLKERESYFPYNPPNNNKIMFIIHGLTGGSDTRYIQSLVRDAQLQGYRVAAFNHRGMNQPLSNALISHGGDLSDIEYAVRHVQEKYPEAQLVAVGTSLGGNQLMRYLSQKGKGSEFAAAVSVAGPFDLGKCLTNIENTMYEKVILRGYLQRNLIPNFEVLKSLEETHDVNFNEVFNSTGLKEFHSKFSIKIFGYKSVEEYTRTSYIDEKTIANISVPLLCLHAKDDPVVARDSIPFESLKSNRNIMFAETSHGGHLCWFEGWKPQRWYPKPSIEFLETCLKRKMVQKS